MKFRILTREQREELREERLRSWHKKFLWLPVRMTEDKNDVRWLEFVYRKGRKSWCDDGHYWSWTYADNTFDILRGVGQEQR